MGVACAGHGLGAACHALGKRAERLVGQAVVVFDQIDATESALLGEVSNILSILEHLWIPVIVIGTAGTAGMIRTLRANLLDELRKQYVTTARAKGLSPLRTLTKYPLRMALNFFIAFPAGILHLTGTELWPPPGGFTRIPRPSLGIGGPQ